MHTDESHILLFIYCIIKVTSTVGMMHMYNMYVFKTIEIIIFMLQYQNTEFIIDFYAERNAELNNASMSLFHGVMW